MKSLIVSVFLLVFFIQGCASQELKNRKPVVAGSFYAGTKKALEEDLDKLFKAAKPDQCQGNVLAIIAPHAGYPFSGIVAATSYNQIDAKKNYENIFVIGSSHRASFQGASIYNKGHYETPLGEVRVNLDLANQLIDENQVFICYEQAHLQEHSLEVQMPFLQYKLKKNFSIVPILLGTHSPEICFEIAKVLYPYFNDKNLFIISADFSHYPAYEDACKVDSRTAESIQSNSVNNFVQALNLSIEEQVPNLSTSICAWPAVLTILYITQDKPEIKVDLVDYQNSGDVSIGDKSRVVGYYSISFSEVDFTINSKNKDKAAMINDPDFTLSEKDKEVLLDIARETLDGYILYRDLPEIDPSGFSESLLAKAGAFVTLNKDGKLRGCIGRFNTEGSLYNTVRDMAISASTKDHRFTPVTPPELDDIEIEISVLTPLKKINSIEEIELGKHGIYIKKGLQSGTFLPQVASKTNWTVEEFLGHCAKDKAMIGWDGWKDAEIFIYEAIIFSENELHQ